MSVLTEFVLVIDNSRKFDSIAMNALSSLGYRNLSHTSFQDGVKTVPGFPSFDAVVVYWANELPIQAVAAVIGAAVIHCSCQGALMISPFCTARNIELFRSHGVRAWVMAPFTRRDLGARLRYVLEGERRHREIPVAVERRRRAPMPAFA